MDIGSYLDHEKEVGWHHEVAGRFILPPRRSYSIKPVVRETNRSMARFASRRREQARQLVELFRIHGSIGAATCVCRMLVDGVLSYDDRLFSGQDEEQEYCDVIEELMSHLRSGATVESKRTTGSYARLDSSNPYTRLMLGHSDGQHRRRLLARSWCRFIYLGIFHSSSHSLQGANTGFPEPRSNGFWE